MLIFSSTITATGNNFEDEIKTKERICFKSVVTNQECGFNFIEKSGYAIHISIPKTSTELIGILYKLTWTINLKFSLVNGGRKLFFVLRGKLPTHHIKANWH